MSLINIHNIRWRSSWICICSQKKLLEALFACVLFFVNVLVQILCALFSMISIYKFKASSLEKLLFFSLNDVSDIIKALSLISAAKHNRKCSIIKSNAVIETVSL